MTGFNILFEADAASTNAMLAELEKRLSSEGLADFLSDRVDGFLRARIAQRFSGEGDDVSGAWHPLTVATSMIRASQGFPPDHPINVRTGDMRSFLVNSASDVKEHSLGATLKHPPPTTNKFINEKIRTAQQGKSRPRTPPRPVIGVNENDLLFVTSELAAYLMGA